MMLQPVHADEGMLPPDVRAKTVFSLIVCTLGRKDTLRRLFQSLAAQSFRGFEVIVVDQNPPGFLSDVIDIYRSRLTIVHAAATPGLSAARNIGLTYACGPIIAFPDDDCWYEPDTLRTAFDKIQEDNATAIVCGRTTDRDGNPSVSAFLDGPAQVSRKNYLMCGNSNCLFVRREVFAEIGDFDVRLGVGAGTGFHSGEEADLILRALDARLTAHYFPDLPVHHDQVDDTITEAQIRRARAYGRGFGAILRKHRFPALVIAYRVSRPLLGAGLHLIRGRFELARYKWTWGKSIAEGYWRWPPAPGKPSFQAL